jgi:hypothetical protein
MSKETSNDEFMAEHLAQIKLQAAEQSYVASEKTKAIERHLGDAMEQLEEKEVSPLQHLIRQFGLVHQF